MLFESIPVHDERARMLAVAVRRLDTEYRALRNRVVERAGISTAELDVLTAIAGAETISPKRLAAASHLTTSAMTALLDRLAASGLLRREPNPTDRRSVIVALTGAGERLVTDMFQRYVGKFETLLAGNACFEDDLGGLIESLGCLTGAIESDAGEDDDEAALADIA